MPFKTSVTFTYDCGEFEKNMDLALDGRRQERFRGAPRRAAKKNGKLRGFGFSNTIERSAAAGLEGAEIRFDRTGSVSIFSGSINQGQGHETAFKQIVCDRLGLDPNEVTYIQGDTDQVFFAEGTGGSRSAAMSGSAFTMAAEKIEAKAKAIAANMLKVDAADIKFADGVFSSQKTNQHADHQGSRQGLARAEEFAGRHGMRADREGDLCRQGRELSRTASMSASSRSTKRPATVEIVSYNVVDDVGTVINPLLLHGQVDGGIAMGVGQILMEDIKFDEQGQILTGSFMDYAMPRAADLVAFHVDSQSGADQDQSARRQGRRRSRLRRRHAGGRQRAGRRALGARHQARRNAGNAGGAVARDSRGAREELAGTRKRATPSPRLRGEGGVRGRRRRARTTKLKIAERPPHPPSLRSVDLSPRGGER